MWRIRRQPDLVQCLGRRLVGCPAWPIVRRCLFVPLSPYPARVFGALFALRLCRAVRAALAASLCCCCMQRATCCLALATCSLQAASLRSAIFVCVFKFFINPKNNAGNFRLAPSPPAAPCSILPTHTHTHSCNTHTHKHSCNTHTNTHRYTYTKYANNFQLKINFMLQLRPSAKQLLLLLLLHVVAEVAHEMRKYRSQVYCHLGHFLAFNEQKPVKLYWAEF